MEIWCMCMPEVKRVNLIKDIILERDLVYFDLLSSPNDPLGCVSLKLHVYILRIVNWGFPAKVVIYNYVLKWTTTYLSGSYSQSANQILINI